mmetsp:Transcript_5221/g.7649  ORF Transcript_5221/g.7649 Transcript_5221/m.7649 type:complete len:348 (-) Transcript_5221:439-1482(-)
MATEAPQPRALLNPPNDGITALTYIAPTLLASSSWDGCVRIHDTKSLENKAVQATQVPLLSLAANHRSNDQSTHLFLGSLDGSVRSFDIEQNVVSTLGSHTEACSCIATTSSSDVCLSAGWDCTLKSWDTRINNSNTTSNINNAKLQLPGKAFSMDVRDNTVLVATSGRRICIYDVRMNNIVQLQQQQDRESSLKYQTRTARLFPDGTGGMAICIGSIEGRVAIEYVDEAFSAAQNRKKYAFKCHRSASGDVIYPVNCIAFHPAYTTSFCTGGCDGGVVIWDAANKKRLSSLSKFPTSIAALAFNFDGTELAVASSYTFEEGERDHPRDEIFVRDILDSECRPKKKH